MKKILFAIALVITMTLGASAQRGSDSFFGYDYANEDRMSDPNNIGFSLPQQGIGSTVNENAPLGTGLLIMTALGAGYAIVRKRNQ